MFPISWGREIRTPEMTGSEPVALPLGYTPIRTIYYTIRFVFCKRFFIFSIFPVPHSRYALFHTV